MSLKTPSVVFLIVISCFLIYNTQAGAILGFDVGVESFKVFLKYGRSFDVVLNDQSSRKTDSIVGFTPEGQRVYGPAAVQLRTKHPDRVFTSATEFLGKNYSHPTIDQQSHHYLFKATKNGGAYGFPLDDRVYTPEEVVGMILDEGQRFAKPRAGYVRDCVITIPPYFTQHERTALINAASIAGLDVLALVHEGTGAAITLATTRLVQQQNIDTYVIFYDIGASHTTATLVSFFQTTENKKAPKPVLNCQVNATAWDTTLGGREFDHRIATYLLKEAENKLQKNLTGNARVYVRLLKEAKRAKEVLTANKDFNIHIESLTPDDDFSTKLSRKTFEHICADLFERALAPIHTVLKQSNVSLDQISFVELLGGGSRVIKINELLASVFGESKIGRHLNGEEASVYGATYHGATLSVTGKAPISLKVKDVIPYTVAVRFDVEGLAEEDSFATLFSGGGRIGAKKSLYFRTDKDFDVTLLYVDDRLPAGTDPIIAKYHVTNVAEKDAAASPDLNEITVTFKISQSGIIELVRSEAKIVTVSYETVETPEPVPEPHAEEVEIVAETVGEEQKETDEPTETPEPEPHVEDTIPVDIDAPVEEKEPEIREVKRSKSYELKQKVTYHGVDLKPNEIQASVNYVEHLKHIDIERAILEQAKNDLESYVYSGFDKLSDERIIATSTEEERETLRALFNEISDWIYSDGVTAGKAAVDEKLSSLRTLGDRVFRRHVEADHRVQVLSIFEMFIPKVLREMDEVFEVRRVDVKEKEDFITKTNELSEWVKTVQEKQKLKKPHEDPEWLSGDLRDKMEELQRAVASFSRRPSRPSPSPSPKPTILKAEPKAETEDEVIIGEENIDIGETLDQIIIDGASEDDFRKRSEL